MMKDRQDQHTRKVTVRPVAVGVITLMTIAMAVTGFFLPEKAEVQGSNDAAQVRSDTAELLSEGCAVVQQLNYTRCSHSITRRQTLPIELIGKSRADAEAAYEPYRITSFASDEIRMEQMLDMFCADHLVLMADASGMLCVFENKYGDALALVRETDIQLSSLPASCREEILPGKAFDTLMEIEQWLESIES